MAQNDRTVHDSDWWERVIAKIEAVARSKGVTDEELAEARRQAESEAGNA